MKKILVLVAMFGFAGSAFAQDQQDSLATDSAKTPNDGVYTKENIRDGKIAGYAYLREADVMYSRRVWRFIDVKEKNNQIFTYPKSKLIDVIMNAVVAGELTVYDPTPGSIAANLNGDEFTKAYTVDAVNKIGASIDTIDVDDGNGGTTKKIVKNEFNRDDVIGYRVKEEWFFDKQRSIFEPRIIGIAPVRINRNSAGESIGKSPLFWIYFNDARQLFANAEAFNRFNDGMRLSWDDIFVQRLFSSYITKISNVKDERIEDYQKGMDALLEAQRFKDELIQYEHDLWEY